VQLLFAILAEEIGAAKLKPELADFAARLEKASGDLQTSTMWFVQNGLTNPNNAGAGAVSYMHLMGITALGLMWLRMASAAQALLAAGEGDKPFLEAKLVTARFFAEQLLPQVGALSGPVTRGAALLYAISEEHLAA